VVVGVSEYLAWGSDARVDLAGETAQQPLRTALLLAPRKRKVTMDDDWRSFAPAPWRIEDHMGRGWGYFSIVDARGLRVCDFFPDAAKDGRGRDSALELARQITRKINETHDR
jgi:hypothetical protein